MAASLHDFNAWLIECEEKLGDAVVNKPKTRIEACQLLASITELQSRVDDKSLPDEIYIQSYDEEDDDIDRGDLIRRFRSLRTSVSDNLAKVETLCVCWDKLNADMSELTRALNSGGAGKLTVEKLEDSIAQIKEMFKERTTLIDNFSTTTPGAYDEGY